MSWQPAPATLAASPRTTVTGGYQGPSSSGTFIYVRTGYVPPDLLFIHDVATGLVYLLGSLRIYSEQPQTLTGQDLHSPLPAEYWPARAYSFTGQPDNGVTPSLTVNPDGRLTFTGNAAAHSDGASSFGVPYYTTLTVAPTFYPLNI